MVREELQTPFSLNAYLMIFTLKSANPTLAGRLRWLQFRPAHQKVAGSIPGQGTYLGYGFDP